MPIEESIPPLGAIFAEIEQTPMPTGTQAGVAKRRIPSQSPCDLFIGAQKPANIRLFTARFRADVLPDKYDLPNFKSLEIQVQRGMEDGAERLTVTVRAPQAAWNDIFTSLAEDMARAVGSATEESEAAQIFRSRLLQWQTLLQKTGTAGLTEEQQQGLYGELWCLREIALPHMQAETALRAWRGPEGADQDFQFSGGIAIEVKTTQTAQPQMLTISSEWQLDATGLNALYLLHLSTERANGVGETLPQIVESVKAALAADPIASLLFGDKLLNAGYLDAHTARYRDAGYTLRNVHRYWVRNDFPRIVEQELRDGVGRVRYAISAAACLPFAVDAQTLTEQIKEA